MKNKLENKATVCMLDFCGRLCQSSNYHHSRTWTCPPSALAPSPASYSDPSSMTELHLLPMCLGHSELSEGNKQQQQQKNWVTTLSLIWFFLYHTWLKYWNSWHIKSSSDNFIGNQEIKRVFRDKCLCHHLAIILDFEWQDSGHHIERTKVPHQEYRLSLIHISEPTRLSW